MSLLGWVLLVLSPDLLCLCVSSGVSLAPLERLELFRTGVALDHLKPSLNRGLAVREPVLNPDD